MRRVTGAIVLALVLVALVVQTTLFSRLSIITPDLVLLVVILLGGTRVRPEAALIMAFLSGVFVDLASSGLLGLRGVVFACVAFIAVRTSERAEVGRVFTVVWVGVLTLVGTVLVVIVGTLFGQSSLTGATTPGRVFLIPLANMIVAALIAPWVVRVINRDSTSLRYS